MDKNAIDEAAATVFLRDIFDPRFDPAPGRNVAFSPLGFHFLATLLKKLTSAVLLTNWDRLASATDLIRMNDSLQGNPAIVSKSVVAGTWSDSVPAAFSMKNFETFNTVDVAAIGSFLGLEVDELAGSVSAAVHYVKFGGSWQTRFDKKAAVTFSDGIRYSFMKATVPSVPLFENEKLTMVTLPFKTDAGAEEVTIDFILPKKLGDAIDLGGHAGWISNQSVQHKVKIIIPKVKFEHKVKIDLSTDPSLETLQKVQVEWDEDGVKAEAVTMAMSRSLPPPVPEFVASRPFYFIIRKGETWLFAGYISSVDASLNALNEPRRGPLQEEL